MSKSFPFYLTDINAESGSYVVRRKHASLGDSDDDRRERASLRDSYVVRRKHASLRDSDDDRRKRASLRDSDVDRRERASLRDSDDVSVLCPGKCHLVSKFIKSREPSMESFTARYTVYPILQNFEKP